MNIEITIILIASVLLFFTNILCLIAKELFLSILIIGFINLIICVVMGTLLYYNTDVGPLISVLVPIGLFMISFLICVACSFVYKCEMKKKKDYDGQRIEICINELLKKFKRPS